MRGSRTTSCGEPVSNTLPRSSTTARSIKGFSRRQVAWLNLKYVTEDVLEKAIVEVINTYNKFDPASPFGGYKESGFGREGGVQGLWPYLA